MFNRRIPGIVVCTAFVLAQSCAGLVAAQDSQVKKVTQTAGVNNTKMGAYQALAEMSYRAFQKGDNATAAELARVLERAWDAAEGGGGDRSLAKTNKELFGAIDKAMDVYIKPVMNYAAKTPDPASIETAYNDFLEKLKQADQLQ